MKRVKCVSKRESIDFRLTSVAQKRLCLSSLFLLTVFIILKLLLKIMQEITGQFSFQILLPGGGPVVAFCGGILGPG